VSETLAATMKAWVLASRPKTLFAAVAPVLLGSALAFSQSKGNLPAAIAALFGAICIQIATNLANDYWDAKKGADTADRLGPVRVTASGLLKPRTVFLGMVFFFLLASAAGVFLTLRAGWPVVAIGLASIFFGILYTAGPFSLAYLGLGEVFTFLFFGLVATAGTYFVQALSYSPDAVLLGVMPGCYSVVLIALNNLRDRATDQQVNKKTLAVRFGEKFARIEILFFLFVPSIIPLFILQFHGGGWLCAMAAFLSALRVGGPLVRLRDPRVINDLLPHAGSSSLFLAILVSVFLLM
jgi:1,4-dihydroxy-2-naphthoate octaprenyltransferase